MLRYENPLLIRAQINQQNFKTATRGTLININNN